MEQELVLWETEDAEGTIERMSSSDLMVWLAQHPEGDYCWLDS